MDWDIVFALRDHGWCIGINQDMQSWHQADEPCAMKKVPRVGENGGEGTLVPWWEGTGYHASGDTSRGTQLGVLRVFEHLHNLDSH